MIIRKAIKGYILEGFTRCEAVYCDPEFESIHVEFSCPLENGETYIKLIYLKKTLFHKWVIWLAQHNKISRIQYSADNECIYGIDDSVDKTPYNRKWAGDFP
jgi:hypothetical protein